MKGNTLEKKNQKLADLWLVGKMVNRIGIYGSKVAEGLSAFQRRSCLLCWPKQMFEQTVGLPVILDALVPIVTPL